MSFEDFFDFDGDGKLNVIEQATAYTALFGNDGSDDIGFHSSYDDSDDIGYHSPYDDDDDEPAESYDEYDEYDDYADDEFEDEDEEEEGDLFGWEKEDTESIIGTVQNKTGLKPYKERLSRIVELIEKVASDTDNLLLDVELNPADSDKKYELIEALENAKSDLDLLTADLEKVLE